jgi:mercuric ion transport protein
MPTVVDRARAVLPSGLTGLAGLACAACCAIPVLLAAGVLSGAGWAAAGAWMPGIAVALIALAAGAWWVSRRRHRGGCVGGTTCGCATSSSA